MGPLSNWGKKSIVISGGTQYTLEDLMEEGSRWEKMGKMREVTSVLNQAADAGKKLFEKDMNSLQIKWMETEEGEVIRVGDEDIKENGAIFAQAFSVEVAVQELDETVNKITVVREENEKEIRDVVYVGEALAPSKIVFSTLCKPKGKERASVTDMKARTILLAHEQVIKATLDSLRTISFAYGRVIKATFEHTKKNNHKLQLVITRPRASVNIQTSSVTKELHHSPMGK